MFDVEYQPGEDIMQEGDDGDNLYVLESGVCEVYIRGKGKVHAYDNEGAFGELALVGVGCVLSDRFLKRRWGEPTDAGRRISLALR
jgi:CRP-like cAMP-binding protein